MLDKQFELETLTEQNELDEGKVKSQENNSEPQQTAQTDTKKVGLKGKQTKVTREKPMVVTDDDLRDISNYRKYKIKAKPVSSEFVKLGGRICYFCPKITLISHIFVFYTC